MKIEERLVNYPRHPSIRGEVGYRLYKQMVEDKDIYIVVGDLGYKLFDPHREDFPDRFINVGAAEQTMLGVAVGLALSGKKPFVYSITSFLLYRGFEWIRNYIDYENIPVRFLGSGLNKDYSEDGISHHCTELDNVFRIFSNIQQLYPLEMDDVKYMIEIMVESKEPIFMGIKR